MRLIFNYIILLGILLNSEDSIKMEKNKSKLSKLQYEVTQNCGTEPPLTTSTGIIKSQVYMLI